MPDELWQLLQNPQSSAHGARHLGDALVRSAEDAALAAAGLGWPVALGWLAAMGVSGLAGLLVGAVALRLRHDYLAITTFGFAVVVQLVAL